MHKKEILAFFAQHCEKEASTNASGFIGVSAVAFAFQMSKGAISKWPDDKPVPENIALLAEKIGKIIAKRKGVKNTLIYDPIKYGRNPEHW